MSIISDELAEYLRRVEIGLCKDLIRLEIITKMGLCCLNNGRDVVKGRCDHCVLLKKVRSLYATIG
jgi:hypothetical protein